jgi:oligopeptidase B
MDKRNLIAVLTLLALRLSAQEFTPPVAKKVPSSLIIHSDTLTDNYYWMRDKTSAEVINHLYAENAYADNIMKGSLFLQKVIYEEYKSRIKEENVSRPRKHKGYFYYSKTFKGKDYAVTCRKKDSLTAPEQVILDINKLAEEQPYISVSGYNISPDQRLLYYGIDGKGNRVMTYYLKNIDLDTVYRSETIRDVMGFVWAEDNKTVYYTKPEGKSLRQARLFKHVLGSPVENDELVFEETDKTREITISKSSSKEYLFISVSTFKSGECWYMKADGTGKPQIFLKREPNLSYSIDHYEGDEFVIITDKNAVNYKLMKAKISAPDPLKWEEIMPYNDKVLLESFRFTKNFIVLKEKENAQERIRIIDRRTNSAFVLDPGIGLYAISYSFEDYDYKSSSEFEYSFSNIISPQQTWTYNLNTGAKTFVEMDSVRGNFDVSKYETKRIYATARDGAIVPITLAYKKGLQLDGNNPTHLYSYGSYGAPNSTAFNFPEISMLDRGFVYALAHIRGSNDLGNQWYENGKVFHKKNTFYDFIDCAEYLIAQRYTRPGKLAIEGGSAGGLLMGAVTNMRPDLFNCVVAGVPFVDVINTMLDETLPLTTFEFDEWGNPKKKDQYQYMKSYSPYDNVQRKAYPNILATAGYNDSQVAYWEPAKWVAKLRELKADTNLLLFKTNMDGGHGGGSGRTTQLKELAFKTAFIMRCLGVKENYISVKGKIIDEHKTEIPFVNVYIEGTTNGTTSNADGEFVLNVKEEKDVTLVFQTLGYVQAKVKIDLNTQVSDLLVRMKSEDFQLKMVVIKANAKDPAYAIMREAIKRRKENSEKVQSFSADIYMKSNVKLLQVPKKIPFFMNKKDFPDSTNLGMIYLSESVARYSYKRPDKKKEEMIASKVAGTSKGFSWNRVEDVFMNFYEPSIEMGYYSERPFVSPLANGSLFSYKYKYLGTFYVDAKPVHKIQIIPRRKGDPLFHGEMYIAEGDNYQIYSSDFYITKDAQIDFADTVHIKQEMIKVNDSIWVPMQMQVYSHIKVFGFAAKDLSTASISNYKLNSSFSKKYFSNEVFRIDEEATKKDSGFWVKTRPSILSEDELKYYHKGDSTLKRQETKAFKDSVNKANSKLSFGLDGISQRNDFKGTSFRTNGLFNMVSYNTVEGMSYRLSGTFVKWNKETRKASQLSGFMRYGWDNKRLSGGIMAYRAFNPKKRQSILLRAGRYMKQYNSHEPIDELLNVAYTLFDKRNFMKLYQKDMISFDYAQELFNGFYSNTNVQYMQREALQNRSFYYWVKKSRHFTSNNPLNVGTYNDSAAFAPHQAFQLQIAFKWIPFAKYESYPTGKRIVETKWPEFSFAYKKGIGTQNAKFNYDYLEMGMGKDLEMRIFGVLSFDVSAGAFLNNADMNFVDYKHFSGNQTIFLMNRPSSDVPGFSIREPISEFHALNYYTYSTNDKFVELHVSHNFRGFFLGKIPLLRKTRFYEIAGLNALFTPVNSYTEVFIGADKIFKVFRFDVGTAISSDKKINPFYRFGLRLAL